MGKKTAPVNNNNNNNRSQHHLSRESGRIRQRQQEQELDAYHNNEDQQQKPMSPEEKYANNVNLLLLNLNSNPEQIYRQTLGKMLSSMVTPFHQKFTASAEDDEKNTTTAKNEKEDKNNSNKKNENNKKNQKQQHQQASSTSAIDKASFFSEDQQSATMLVRFPDKFTAKKFAQKLNHTQLLGTSSNQQLASVVTTESLKPRYEPCALRITELSVPFSAAAAIAANTTASSPNKNELSAPNSFNLSQLQQYLSSNPGFLSVSRVARVGGSGSSSNTNNNNNNNNNNNKNRHQHEKKNNNNNDDQKRCFVATYADSGAALQARALMSGRAFHGIHLLFELISEEDEQIVPLV